MAFTTYIVRCTNDSLYTGWTNDLLNRISAHNDGRGARYTRGKGPVVLEAAWEFDSKSLAMRAEWLLKSLPRKDKLSLIAGERQLADIFPDLCPRRLPVSQ